MDFANMILDDGWEIALLLHCYLRNTSVNAEEFESSKVVIAIPYIGKEERSYYAAIKAKLSHVEDSN